MTFEFGSHNTRQRILQLVKDTSAKLKILSDSDRDITVNVCLSLYLTHREFEFFRYLRWKLQLSYLYICQASKKVEDAKLARDFQTTLQEFQKVQQLASERESTYSPAAAAPSSSLSTAYFILVPFTCFHRKLVIIPNLL